MNEKGKMGVTFLHGQRRRDSDTMGCGELVREYKEGRRRREGGQWQEGGVQKGVAIFHAVLQARRGVRLPVGHGHVVNLGWEGD